MEWVSRVLAISLEMVLPGLAGQWLDTKFGTRFLVLVGFALGVSVAIWHLTRLGKSGSQPKSRQGPGSNAGESQSTRRTPKR
jgi:hypothetical protein